MIKTNCLKCYFADKAGSQQPCVFHIPEAIKDVKTLDIVDDFFSINDYACRYGVSRETVEQKILKDNPDINIIEYAKHQARIKYILYIKVNKHNFIEVCDNIKSLSIAPQLVHICFDINYDFKDIPKLAQQQFTDCSFKWKLHKFVEDEVDYKQFHTSVSTNNELLTIKNIWILNEDMLTECAQNDYINTINYIMNVEQPKLAILKHSKAKEYLYGLFMTTENLNGIWSSVSQNLDPAIRSLYGDDDIQEYD